MSTSKQYQQLIDTMNQWLAKTTQPSQYETDLGAYNSGLRNWLASGDFRNPQSVGGYVDFGPAAKAYEQMQYSGPGDNVAPGAMNPHSVASQREINNSAFNDIWGNMYEQNAANVRDQSNSIQNQLASLYQNRNQTGIQGASNILAAYDAKPKSFLSKVFSAI